MNENTLKKCTKCNVDCLFHHFKIKKNGDYNKNCNMCLEAGRNLYAKKGRKKCLHEKRTRTCRVCRPDAFCPHKKQPHRCRECLDNESVIKYTFKNMISHSRQSDKKYNRLDEDHFIDLPFLYTKMTDYPELECYHCKKNMSFKPEKKIDLITIERLNNKIGHIKSNCEFCCLDCNLKKISNKLK